MFPPRRVPTVNYNWSEFLEGNGIITFYGSLQPGKTTKYEYFEGPRDSTKAHGMDTIWTAQTFAIGTLMKMGYANVYPAESTTIGKTWMQDILLTENIYLYDGMSVMCIHNAEGTTDLMKAI
ncbi:hypothetical protein LCGC14_1696410 [marine sediment metagenome]|uniref:Uncharacterized protein n=1 Tax=marine sediment metagenome TaxID=412755 RepID=A0A0F9HJQ8_9ZZZZ